MAMNSVESQIMESLIEHKLRPTGARMQIMHVLWGKNKHLTAEEIIEAIHKSRKKASIATVYQNLAKMADAGLLKRFTGNDRLVRYDANLMPHHHMNCTKCGKIIDVELDKKLRPKIKPLDYGSGDSPPGWKVDSIQLEFKGICPKCRSGK